ncbi:hypothetical protein AAG570_013886 [Ranatra chinensis]|uniref:Uncharacterized protein n=1 Tax=Ranatra chinensis TaxID=642074 RepID=A0ABD0Z1Q5_9HEMI
MASKRRNMFHKNKTQETTEKEELQLHNVTLVFPLLPGKIRRGTEPGRSACLPPTAILFRKPAFLPNSVFGVHGESASAARVIDKYVVLNGGSNVSLPVLEASSGCRYSSIGSETLEPPFNTTRSTPEDSALVIDNFVAMALRWMGWFHPPSPTPTGDSGVVGSARPSGRRSVESGRSSVLVLLRRSSALLVLVLVLVLVLASSVSPDQRRPRCRHDGREQSTGLIRSSNYIEMAIVISSRQKILLSLVIFTVILICLLVIASAAGWLSGKQQLPSPHPLKRNDQLKIAYASCISPSNDCGQTCREFICVAPLVTVSCDFQDDPEIIAQKVQRRDRYVDKESYSDLDKENKLGDYR